MVTLALQVHQAPLDLLDLLFPSAEDTRISQGIIQLLKERKVIVDHRGHLKFKVSGQPLTFTL